MEDNHSSRAKVKAEWLTKELVLFFGFLACGIFAPQIFHLIGQQALGVRISPMHVFVLLCGFVCGKRYGALCGFLMPLISSLIFTMPPIYPTAVGMAFEMLVYGYLTGLLKDKMHFVFALLLAMLGGRLVLGVANIILYALQGGSYSFDAYVSSLFVNGWPSIVCAFVIVGGVLLIMVKAGVISFKNKNE